MSKHTILIVEDNTDIVRGITENISEISDNYTFKVAYDGKDVLDILEKEKMDLVILDVQVPGMNGLHLLTSLQKKGIWLPIIILTDSNIDEQDKRLREFGVVELLKKPFLPEKLVIRIAEIMKNRANRDLIKNLSLPSILQLIEMEKRTGILFIKIGPANGRIFFRSGKLMDIEVKGLSTAEALEKFIHSLYEDREISIEYIDHIKDKKIDMSLMQMVMEASRIKDERKIPRGNEGTETAKEKESKNQHLPLVVDLIGSLKEVESYIVTDAQGDVLAVSSADYNRDISNSSFYLWVIGNSMGKEFNLGGSANLTCYFKTRKRFIQRYMDYIIMLELSDMTKLSVFKNKLKELFEKLALNMGAGRT